MSLRNRTLSVTRRDAGEYTAGIWVPSGDTTVFSIKASVQPLTARELRSLSEARRNIQSHWIFSSTELLNVDIVGVTNPDIVVVDGDNYEVFSTAPWQNGIISHYKMIVQKISA